ncbi:hypothetical protein Tco_0741931 [Tanacetum coccineum]
MKTARDRQKSYADNRRKPLEFSLGDKVLLKVSPWKGIIRFVEEPIKVMDRDVKKLKQSFSKAARDNPKKCPYKV